MSADNSHTPLDFLAVGEVLVDLISAEHADRLEDALAYRPFPGGQPASLAGNLACMGKRTAIAGCVGKDVFGRMVRKHLEETGCSTVLIHQHDAPTTLAIVGRSQTTPDFLIYRGADALLTRTPQLAAAAEQTRFFHLSAFTLSRNPARTTSLSILETARRAGAFISIDPNYHPGIWPDVPDFKELVLKTLPLADIVKPSLEDGRRLFGEGLSPEGYAKAFLSLGIPTVVLTLGEEGTLLAEQGGNRLHVPSRVLKVTDVTGAGDAFWAGVLSALIDGHPLQLAVCAGQVVAERKLEYAGPLRTVLDDAEVVEAAERRLELARETTAIP